MRRFRFHLPSTVIDFAADVTTVECSDWSEFLHAVEVMDGWIFRGQASANWELVSTLDRFTPAGESRKYAEYNSVREFKRRAHNYLQSQEIPTSDGEWLALMQHFGAPTRLLDFTTSPFAAAYFAIEDLPPDDSKQAAIWAISPSWCHHAVGRIALSHPSFMGLSAKDIRAGMLAFKGADAAFVPEYLDFYIAGSLVSGRLGGVAMGTTRPLAMIYQPDKLTDRMSAQQGVFVWPGDVERSLQENLHALGDLKSGVRKILYSHEDRGRALAQLRLMNITRTSLFPGLEGFAQSFRQSLVREPVERSIMRLSLSPNNPWRGR